MANVMALLKEEGVLDTIPRFSDYTEEQIRLLLKHCNLTLIKFEEIDKGLRIYCEEPVTYLDFLNELNRLLSNVEDIIVEFKGDYTLITCIYTKKTIEIVNEERFIDYKNSL